MKASFRNVITLFFVMSVSMAQAQSRYITSVAPVSVSTPEGTVPRLPWQVWVTYSDGTHEWRQVRWNNALKDDEAAEAAMKVGARYQVEGVVTGDNTTTAGFPLKADVEVVKEEWQVPAPTPKAQPLPLGKVMLTGQNRLTSNRDLDLQAILSWDVSQQLYNYRDTYGLPTEGYKMSDGWDSPTTKLKGHGTGHYMSALAFAFASAHNAGVKEELRKRIRRMVDELRLCQERTFVWNDSLGRYWEARDLAPESKLRQLKGSWKAFDEYKKDYRHYGYGYLNAIPAQHAVLIECYRPYNNEEWVWAPYYSIHKQLAGLIDIANNIDDQEIAAKALLIAKDMGLWVWNRMHYRTYVMADGDRQQRQARPGNRYEMWNMYIAGEVGGMCESLSRLSEMVSDKTEKARLLEAANCFDAPALFEPVSRNVDDVRTRHANQHIPMFVGALRSYRSNANPFYYNLSLNFWNMVQGRYAYAMGGVGNGEMFRQPYSQILSMNTNVGRDAQGHTIPNPDINETCCAYNLAKLTKELNGYDPDDARYMDYYERVLYNQIVGSVHPTHYACTYQYAVGMNAVKPYGNETPQSTCCGGTGSENHEKYQEAVYFVNDSCVWVALYMPTQAQWDEQGVRISQECAWPAERSVIRVQPLDGAADGREGGRFAMKLRVPYWATEGFDVKLNGKSVAVNYQPCSYVEIPAREWTATDVVEVVMPFTKHIHFGPDKMSVVATPEKERMLVTPQWVGALMCGPLVMTTPDVHSWKEADFNLKSDLSDVQLVRTTVTNGTDGNLYRMVLAGKNFVPDYYATTHTTHYLRLNVQAKKQKKLEKNGVDGSALDAAMSLARERQNTQEKWQHMKNKVPAYAPWAPHGYARMLELMQQGEDLKNRYDKVKQKQVDELASTLSVVINNMRPGNLAEPEDLSALLDVLAKAKNVKNGKKGAHLADNVNPADLEQAIEYAEMVVGYVNDGSGTHDLIDKALKGLQSVVSE